MDTCMKRKYKLQCCCILLDLVSFRHHIPSTLLVSNQLIQIYGSFTQQSKTRVSDTAEAAKSMLSFSKRTVKRGTSAVTPQIIQALEQNKRSYNISMEDLNSEDDCFKSQHPNVNALEQFASLTLHLRMERKMLNME